MKKVKLILASVALLVACSAIYANAVTVVYYVANGPTNCGTIVTATGCLGTLAQCTVPINSVQKPLFYKIDQGTCTIARLPQ